MRLKAPVPMRGMPAQYRRSTPCPRITSIVFSTRREYVSTQSCPPNSWRSPFTTMFWASLAPSITTTTSYGFLLFARSLSM